ncbi:FtsH protease activity modulator HflK [Methylophilaceae bacterium]|nr:FtsH protease activity modulator HflK [Methylophilaceae bacterium]MDG1095385.1 FtsH protease activity modulator HflK [Methylophilaceae bacterium]
MRKLFGFVGNRISNVIRNANNDGPPDLDELVKDLKSKVNNVFKLKPKNTNNGNGSQPPSDNSGDSGIIKPLPIVIVIFLVWLATGFYIVDQGSRGVVLTFGENTAITLPGPRWHIPYPIETVEIVNQEQVRTIEVGYRSLGEGATQQLKESLMLTGDENIIDLQFAVQYNLKSVEDFLFNNRSVEGSVRGAAETAIREVVGKSDMDFVLYEGREEIAIKTKSLMQSILDLYQTGINITSVTMQNAQPPQQVQAAFDDAVKAKQDLERQKNEGQAYANDIVPKARGTASRLTAEANGYKISIENEALGNASRFDQILAEYIRAPEVTKKRLFLETQEQIMSTVSKIIIDQKGSNSLLYLPLDKIIQNSSRNNNEAVDPSQASSQTNPDVSASDVINSLTDRSRGAFRARERDIR